GPSCRRSGGGCNVATRSWILPAVIIVGVSAAAVLRGGGAPSGVHQSPSSGVSSSPPATAADFGAVERLQGPVNSTRATAIVLAARRVAPTVVSVNITRREQVQPRSLFESFFIPPGAEQTVQGLGSGFIIRQDGLILTNEHVVRGADQVVVTLPDGRQFQGKVLGTDDVTDLALVRIEGRDLPVAPLGSSDSLMIGEWVVAIGNPFGYLLSNTEPTVTAGVVSGLERNIIGAGGSSSATTTSTRMPGPGDGRGMAGGARLRPAQAGRGDGDDDSHGYYLGMIQTDAAINPGNSGGPLINALGQVIGVNSSILSQSGGSEGLGFAIPIDRARRIVGDLLAYGHVRRAWVGLEVGESSKPEWGKPRRVSITHVAPGSPAAVAGLTAGMTLVSVGGRPVHSALDWEGLLLDARIGAPLALTVDNGRVLRITPRDLPSMGTERVRALSDFELVTVTPGIRAERGIDSESGALIVTLSGDARDIGFREGDVIVQVNRTPVRRAEDAAALLRRYAGHGPLRVVIERDGQLMSISFYVS
ncbi:MAG TPA: trypsin-like peptidase domain-containing protein, partial [Longimicrobiales bacterium]